MNEHAEKQTASCAHEHSKGKSNVDCFANIPNDAPSDSALYVNGRTYHVPLCTVVITSNAPNPQVYMHTHACTRACKQLILYIRIIISII